MAGVLGTISRDVDIVSELLELFAPMKCSRAWTSQVVLQQIMQHCAPWMSVEAGDPHGKFDLVVTNDRTDGHMLLAVDKRRMLRRGGVVVMMIEQDKAAHFAQMYSSAFKAGIFDTLIPLHSYKLNTWQLFAFLEKSV